MAHDSTNISIDTITEWMASTGFLFPRTILELKRFEKLHRDIQIDLSGHQIDPEVILRLKMKPVTTSSSISKKIEEISLKMAARKGDSSISQDILDKIKLNQTKRKNNDPGSSESGAE